MKRIPLTQGKYALVDNCDYKYLCAHKWAADRHYKGNWYAVRSKKIGGKGHAVYMHREIMFPKVGNVDHINGDGLDNRRKNLQICTHSQNIRKGRWQPGASGYHGVYYNRSVNRWIAEIHITENGEEKKKRIGSSTDKVLAAKMYDAYVAKRFGKFAKLNFPRKK